jgi:hypothetical protein
MDLGKWLRVEWDRAVSVTCMVLGAVCLLVGWFGISRTPYPAEQLPYILSGGISGVFLLGLGATFWLSADLRDEWSKLDSIDESLQALAGSSLVNQRAMGNGHGNSHADSGEVRPAPAQDSAYGPPVDQEASLAASPTDPGYAMVSAPRRRQRPLRASDEGVIRRGLADDVQRAP